MRVATVLLLFSTASASAAAAADSSILAKPSRMASNVASGDILGHSSVTFDKADSSSIWAAFQSSGLPESFAAAMAERSLLDGRGGRRRINREENSIPETYEDLRACNEVIGTYSKEEILEVADKLVLAALPAQFRLLAAPAIEGAIRYNVRSWKICASCREVLEVFGGELSLADSESENGFLSYCGPDGEYHDATFSGLLAEPINVTSGLPPFGKVKASIWGRGTETNQFKAPSERWPQRLSDVTDSITKNDDILAALINYLDLLGPIMTATSGTYSLTPDGKGYGEDYENPIGYIQKKAYQMSTVPLYLQAKKMAQESRNGCTVLANDVYLAGYSEGGYGVVAKAAALHELGVNITQVSAGGGPFRTASVLPMYTVEQNDNGLWPDFALPFLPLVGYSFSSTGPDLPNTNIGQDLISLRYMDEDNFNMNAIAWIDDGLSREEILPLMPEGALEIFNGTFVEFLRTAIRSNISDPCVTEVQEGINDKLCAAMLAQDLIEYLEAAPFPVQVCHSKDDEIVSYANAPDVTKNSFLSEIAIPPAEGSHFEAFLSCILGALIPFTSFGGNSDMFSGIDPPDDETCYAMASDADIVAPTAAPIAEEAPSMMPAEQKRQDGADALSVAHAASGGYAAVTTSLFVTLLASISY